MPKIQNLATSQSTIHSGLVPTISAEVTRLVQKSLEFIEKENSEWGRELQKDKKTLSDSLHTMWLWIFTACANEKMTNEESLPFMQAVLGYHGANTGINFGEEFKRLVKVLTMVPSGEQHLSQVYYFPIFRTDSHVDALALEPYFKQMHALAEPAHIAIFGTSPAQIEALRASVDEPARVRKTQITITVAIILSLAVLVLIKTLL